MNEMEKPEAHGSPGQKAKSALGEKLNRPSKTPPPLPPAGADKEEPPARRVAEEVDEL